MHHKDIGQLLIQMIFEEYSNIKQSVADIYNYIKKELDNPYYDDNAYLERINGYRNVLKFIEENKIK